MVGPKPIIIYVSTNDGTDMRINKEIRSLSTLYRVYFVGVSPKGKATGFLNDFTEEIHLISGRRNHPITLIKQIFTFLRITFKNHIHSVHIVNEQLMIFFWPFLFFHHTVLDVFDSVFLRFNINRDQWNLIKRLVYAPCNNIIVTDEERYHLMPDFLKEKIAVLPNYPFRYKNLISKKVSNDSLRILFFGWLGMNRGGTIAKGLLEADSRVVLTMLGWFTDDECRNLIDHPRVSYKGVVPQDQALKIAADQADYILCLYEPINQNMINASPNKIYDAIQTETPLLINKEVKASCLVEELNIGLAIPTYYPENYVSLVNLMIEKKTSFDFPESIKEKYTWEAVENILISKHLR